jgi:hypothetical protein
MMGRGLSDRDRRSRRRAMLAAVGWLWLVSAAALPAILRYLNVR